MNYENYAKGISFRIMQPDSPLRSTTRISWLTSIERGYHFDLNNTILPDHHEEMKIRLAPILGIPRMSTFAVAALINEGVSRMKEGDAFVNVGVWHGFTFLAGMADNPGKICVGVDNFSEFHDGFFIDPKPPFLGRFEKFKSPNHSFHEMDYKDYFAKIHKGPIGFYVYDGEHSYDNQLNGLKVAEPFFSGDCVILVDDTNLEEPRRATFDFISGSRNKYKILLDAPTAGRSHPTFWNGVILFQRVS